MTELPISIQIQNDTIQLEIALDNQCWSCKGSGYEQGLTACRFCKGKGFLLTENGEAILNFIDRYRPPNPCSIPLR